MLYSCASKAKIVSGDKVGGGGAARLPLVAERRDARRRRGLNARTGMRVAHLGRCVVGAGNEDGSFRAVVESLIGPEKKTNFGRT